MSQDKNKRPFLLSDTYLVCIVKPIVHYATVQSNFGVYGKKANGKKYRVKSREIFCTKNESLSKNSVTFKNLAEFFTK